MTRIVVSPLLASRASFASQLATRGVPRKAVQELLGHPRRRRLPARQETSPPTRETARERAAIGEMAA
jgi:hypothetical protein